MTDKTCEAFDYWWDNYEPIASICDVNDVESAWKSATAEADAKYLPVIEKLVEALAGEQRLREIIRNAEKARRSPPRVEDFAAYRPTDNETHNALSLAAPLLAGKKEEV